MAKKFNDDDLKKAADDWNHHHALVAAVRRIVKLAGGVDEAKAAIDGVALAQQFEQEMNDEDA